MLDLSGDWGFSHKSSRLLFTAVWDFEVCKMFINAHSASLRSLVAAESKAAEIKAAVACFESVCQL